MLKRLAVQAHCLPQNGAFRTLGLPSTRTEPRPRSLARRPAAVTADPSSGTIPTGYLILNVTTGHIKRHAGGYVWEIPAA